MYYGVIIWNNSIKVLSLVMCIWLLFCFVLYLIFVVGGVLKVFLILFVIVIVLLYKDKVFWDLLRINIKDIEIVK